MRVSVAIRQPVHRQYPDGQSLLESSQAKPGQFYVFLAQTDRAGQACEAPDASSILAEDTFSSDSSTDRAAGYGPANEGSSPSPNTISSRRSRVTIYDHTYPLGHTLLVSCVHRATISGNKAGPKSGCLNLGQGFDSLLPDHFEGVA